MGVDPQSKVGYYGHLVDQGYLLQERRGFSFALTPEIKTWREAVAESSRGSVGHALGQEEEVEDAEDDEDMEAEELDSAVQQDGQVAEKHDHNLVCGDVTRLCGKRFVMQRNENH